MMINHVCDENDWIGPDDIKGVKTLILGSFNPYNPNGNNTDFYYGRKCNHSWKVYGRQSNYFWKVVASLLDENENYFTGNLENKLRVMNDYKFCFMDIITSIEITSPNREEAIVEQFCNDHIFENLTDSMLFKSTYNKGLINISRTYNKSIIDTVVNKKINRIIHTIGNRKISPNFVTKPLEIELGDNGFQGYINSINNLESEFNKLSYNPSAYAVRTGGIDYLQNLTIWISENLGINQN
ncbi:MAG: hypothetical protein ABJI22_01555 [Maribacter sp.]